MQVAETAQPFHAGTGRVGVLFCHGFTGSPLSLREWAETTAAAGLRVALPRLPGHGTSWQEMNLTGWQDWYSAVEREFNDLRDNCDVVFVAGLSMGGALALRLAEKYPDEVAGLILVNPAVQGYANMALIPVLKHIVPSVGAIGSDIAVPGVDEHAYSRTPLRAAASMLRLWADVRPCLDLVSCPLLMFRSATDHVVPNASKEYILSHVSSDVIIDRVLARSYHVATMDYDKDAIFSGTLDFIRDHSGVTG